MTYVYIKDIEGYVMKKPETELQEGDKVISEKEYLKLSGLSHFKEVKK